MELSKKIALARKKKGLTQEQLADLTNVTVRTIQRIESGESTPRAFTIKALAEALETNFEDLSLFGEVQNSPFSNGSVLFQNSFNLDNERHMLKVLCLSCFSYLALPLIHFLIPIYYFKKSGISHPKTISVARSIIRQQIYWVVTLSFLMLLAMAYNFIANVYFEASYLLHYLWLFFAMYILNAFIIVRSLIRINTIDYEHTLTS